jgi:hypothetical protein
MERTQGLEQDSLSAYCQPQLSFIHSEMMKDFGHPKEGHATTTDNNITSTTNRVLASSIGKV